MSKEEIEENTADIMSKVFGILPEEYRRVVQMDYDNTVYIKNEDFHVKGKCNSVKVGNIWVKSMGGMMSEIKAKDGICWCIADPKGGHFEIGGSSFVVDERGDWSVELKPHVIMERHQIIIINEKKFIFMHDGAAMTIGMINKLTVKPE